MTLHVSRAFRLFPTRGDIYNTLKVMCPAKASDSTGVFRNM